MERLNQGKSGRRFVLRHAVGDLLRKAGSYIDGSKFLCCYIALLGPDNHDLDAIKDLCSRVIAGLRRLAVDEPLRTRILERAAGHVLPEELGAQLLLERAVELTRSLAHLNATGRALGGKHYLGTDADFLALFGTDAAYARETFLILEERPTGYNVKAWRGIDAGPPMVEHLNEDRLIAAVTPRTSTPTAGRRARAASRSRSSSSTSAPTGRTGSTSI